MEEYERKGKMEGTRKERREESRDVGRVGERAGMGGEWEVKKEERKRREEGVCV